MPDSLSIQNSLLPPPAEATKSTATQQFLRFHLVPDTTALLPMEQLIEVLTIPLGQIVPIFQMPPWVMGVYNWRGEILWLVDLGHLVGLTPWHQQVHSTSVYRAIVLQSNSTAASNASNSVLGLIVNRVEDIEWCNTDLIQSPPSSTVTPELAPFLRGYWMKSNGDMLVVMEGQAILGAMPK